VFLAKKGVQLPQKGTFFLIAANGAFVRKDTGIFEGLVSVPFKDVPGINSIGYCLPTEQGPVFFNSTSVKQKTYSGGWFGKDDDDDASLTNVKMVNPLTGKAVSEEDDDEANKLLSARPYINMNLPKIPPEIIYRALLFFRKVYRKHRSESAVILCFNVETNEYSLYCPKQDVSGAHVDYDRRYYKRTKRGEVHFPPDHETPDQNYGKVDPVMCEMVKNGFQMVGSIHSHANFSAFHSGTDTHDEASMNGVHITLGHVADGEFSWASSLALNDHREQVEAENVAVGVVRVGDQKAANSKWISTGSQNYYNIELEDLSAIHDEYDKFIDDNWMDKVEHGFFGGKGNRVAGASYGGSSYSRSGGYSSSPYAAGWEYEEDDDGLEGGTSYVMVNGQWVPAKEAEEIEKQAAFDADADAGTDGDADDDKPDNVDDALTEVSEAADDDTDSWAEYEKEQGETAEATESPATGDEGDDLTIID